MIIGLVGFMNSGKTTVGNMLVNDYGFYSESFAKPIKSAVAEIFGWSRELLEGDTLESRKWRDIRDPVWSDELGWDITPRKALQLMGTEGGRNIFGPNLWTSALLMRLSNNLNYVITDVRFANEIAALRRREAMIVRVKRGPDPGWLEIGKEFLSFEPFHEAGRTDRYMAELLAKLPHRSEWDWVNSPVDITIDNDGTLDDLRHKVQQLVAGA